MPEGEAAPLHRRRALLRDSLGYATERVGELALTAIVGVVVARHLGPDGFGLLSYATGVFALLAPVATLGMGSILVREFTTDADWRSVLTAALTGQLPAAVLASLTGCVLVIATRGADVPVLLLTAALAPLPLLSLSESLRAYLEARQRVRRVVVAGLTAAVVAAVLRLAGVAGGAPVWVFAGLVTLQAGLALVGLARGLDGRLTLWAARRHHDRDRARRLVRESWPLFLAGIAVTIYMRVDIILLGVMSGDAEAGLYAAAARLSEVWYFLPMAGLAAIRPRLSALHAAGDRDSYQRLLQRFMTASVGGSLAIVAVVLLAGDAAVRLLYGASFGDAGSVLRIHILAAPFVFLGVASGQWFIDHGRTRAVFVRSATGAALNVGLNLVLIPSLGGDGAAIATLVAYASGVLVNALPRDTRGLFAMQLRALRLSWPR